MDPIQTTTPQLHPGMTLCIALVLLVALCMALINSPSDLDAVQGTQPITYRIDPNTADIDTLCLLPSVGPPTALKIIQHREQHGPFKSAADLEAVPGIGPKTRLVMEPWVVFEKTLGLH